MCSDCDLIDRADSIGLVFLAATLALIVLLVGLLERGGVAFFTTRALLYSAKSRAFSPCCLLSLLANTSHTSHPFVRDLHAALRGALFTHAH